MDQMEIIVRNGWEDKFDLIRDRLIQLVEQGNRLGTILFARMLIEEEKYESAIQLIKKSKYSEDTEGLIFEAYTYQLLGKLSTAQEICEKVRPKVRSNKTLRGILKFIEGSICWREGKLDVAVDRYKEAIEDLTHTNEKRFLGHTYNNYGIILSSKGNWVVAMQLFSEAERIFNEIEFWEGIGMVLVNKSLIFLRRGEIDTLKEISLKILDLASQHKGFTTILGFAKRNLGICAELEGEYDLALKRLTESVDILKQTKYHIGLVSAYFYLIRFFLHQENFEQAEKTYSQFLADLEGVEISLFKFCKNLFKALLLKNSKRPRDKIKSQQILKQLAFGPPIHLDFQIEALFHYIDLLIYELRISGDLQLLNEIEQTLGRLLTIAEGQFSNLLDVEAEMLMAKVDAMRGNYDTAIMRLEKTFQKAELFGFKNLAEEIIRELQLYKKFQKDWFETISDVQTRVELTGLETDVNTGFIEHITGKKIQIKDKPILFFILMKSGVAIYRRTFEWFSTLKINEALLSGFVGALNLLNEELFKKNENRQIIRIESYTFIIQGIKNLVFAYMFKGSLREALLKMDRIKSFILEDENLFKSLNEGKVGEEDLKIFDLFVSSVIEE